MQKQRNCSFSCCEKKQNDPIKKIGMTDTQCPVISRSNEFRWKTNSYSCFEDRQISLQRMVMHGT